MINVIRASQLSRPMSCAGSLFFKDLPPQPTNDAALEGTAAAEYLEKLLMNQPIGTHASNGIAFTEEMGYYAKEVVDEIRSKAATIPIAEEQLDWVSFPSNITVQGRCDVNFIGKDNRLYIDDLKYGFGIVEPKENWQLLAYAIGKIMKLGQAYDLVLRIHQPRAHHEDGTTREWIISYNELLKYKEMIDHRLHEISKGLNTLVTGTQCRYCPAAAHCPASNKAYHRGIEAVTDFVQDNMDDQELSFQLDLVSRIEDLVKTRKGSLELLATSRIKEGKIVPNYISTDNYGHRKWNDNVNPETIQLLTGIDVTEKTLITPAQAEKRGLSKEVTQAFTSRPLLGTRLKRKDSTKEGNKIFGNNKPTFKGE